MASKPSKKPLIIGTVFTYEFTNDYPKGVLTDEARCFADGDFCPNYDYLPEQFKAGVDKIVSLFRDDDQLESVIFGCLVSNICIGKKPGLTGKKPGRIFYAKIDRTVNGYRCSLETIQSMLEMELKSSIPGDIRSFLHNFYFKEKIGNIHHFSLRPDAGIWFPNRFERVILSTKKLSTKLISNVEKIAGWIAKTFGLSCDKNQSFDSILEKYETKTLESLFYGENPTIDSILEKYEKKILLLLLKRKIETEVGKNAVINSMQELCQLFGKLSDYALWFHNSLRKNYPIKPDIKVEPGYIQPFTREERIRLCTRDEIFLALEPFFEKIDKREFIYFEIENRAY